MAAETPHERKGRGWLSSLDLLPEEGQEDVRWAIGELNKRERSQADILFELNDRLAVKGIDKISRSAFNRRSMRLSSWAARMAEKSFIYAGIADRLTPEEISKGDKVLGEFLKTLIDELLDADTLDSKNALELARAYKETIIGQRHSNENRSKEEDRIKSKLVSAIDRVAAAMPDAVAKPDGAAVLKRIREDVYGIFDR